VSAVARSVCLTDAVAGALFRVAQLHATVTDGLLSNRLACSLVQQQGVAAAAATAMFLVLSALWMGPGPYMKCQVPLMVSWAVLCRFGCVRERCVQAMYDKVPGTSVGNAVSSLAYEQYCHKYHC
jgi:hypothetical protein